MAILSVAALDEKSQADGLDVRVRAVVEQVVSSFEKELDVETIPDAEVRQMIENHGELPSRPIDDVPAIDIGRNLDADFVYTGTVATEGGDVIVSVKLIKPPSREVIPEVVDRISENEMPRLEQKVTELVTQLQAYLVAESE
jgi:TolB-like protein